MSSARVGLSVHVYSDPFEYSSRMLKVTKTIVDRAIAERVIIIATARDHLPPQEDVDAKRRVWRVATRLKPQDPEQVFRKALRFVEWSARTFRALQGERIEMVNCHSLATLPLAVALKRSHHSVLVYEPHELETETVTRRGFRRRVAKLLERVLIREADTVIVVSESIAEHYSRDYGLSTVGVIRNAPELIEGGEHPNRALRDRFAIPDDHLVFLYQGLLNEERGARWLLDAFRSCAPSRHIVFLGFGPMQAEIAAVAANTMNIHFHPAVPPGDVLRLTRGADVGFSLLSDDCINHRCALPNKLFHYLHAGLPVIASSHLIDAGRILDRYDCGWRTNNDAASIAEVVSSVDAASIAARRRGALAARDQLHWRQEADRLADIYQQFLGGSCGS